MLKGRTGDLLVDFLHDHKNCEESEKMHVRREKSVENRLNYDAEALKDQILDGMRPK